MEVDGDNETDIANLVGDIVDGGLPYGVFLSSNLNPLITSLPLTI